MKNVSRFQGIAVMLIFGILAAFCLNSCKKVPKELPNRKVIVSNVGEVKKSAGYLEEAIHYRIYYCNISKAVTDIRIIDQLEEGIDNVDVGLMGNFNGATRIASWEFKDVPAGGKGSVEIYGILKKTGTITNYARIQFAPKGMLPVFDSERFSLKNDTGIIESKQLKRRDFGDKPITIETEKVITNVYRNPKTGWIPFTPDSKKGDIPMSAMKDNTTIGAMVNFEIPGVYVNEVMYQDLPYYRFTLPGQGTLTDIGKPELPIIGRIIEVPFDVSFSIEVIKSKLVALDHYRIYPAQEPLPEDTSSRHRKMNFAIDTVQYLADRKYPGKLAVIQAEEIGIIRGHRIVLLKVNPVQYNPVTHLTMAYAQIEVRIRYSKPAQIKAVQKRLYSPYIEKQLKNTLLNYKDARQLGLIPNLYEYKIWKERQGCDYLILTTNTYYNPGDPNNAVVRFANWKRQKGMVTQVVDIASITNGTTTAGIRQYLDNAYNGWNLVPSYILIIGDADQVPVWYQTDHPSHANTKTATDLYYATLDGTDIFPDVYLGRLSVDNLTQATTALDRIINYETQPPANAAFYNNFLLSASFEDWSGRACPPPPGASCSDGTEEFAWIESIENVRTFIMSQGYQADRFYVEKNDGSRNPANYVNGNPLPADLLALGWNSTAADVSGAFRAGRFMAGYRDHGDRNTWSATGFNNNDIDNLNNNDLVPVVYSMCCQTGWFDNETDDASLGTANNEECWAEHFIRSTTGGAVAVVAASRNSWPGYNDFLFYGFVKAVWPGYTPSTPFPAGYPSAPSMTSNQLMEMGQIFDFGKMYMASAYPASNKRTIEFEMFNLFGDPEMAVWNALPLLMEVSHPSDIGSAGEQDFVVKVTDKSSKLPLINARVVLTGTDHNIVAMYETNAGGIARFKLSSPSGSNYDITVTALGYRPYTGKINISSSGATVNRLDPDNGIATQAVHVGGINFSGSENVDIWFDGSLLKTAACSGGSFGQAAQPNVDINVPSPHDLGPVNVVAQGKTSNRFGVDVFQVRKANPVDLYIYDQWDSSTWSLNSGPDNPVWDNPSIQLYEGATPVASNNLIVGHTYRIQATIYNATPYLAQKVGVTFKFADFGMGQPPDAWTLITSSPVETDVPASNHATAEINWTPALTGHICLQAEIYHIEEINTDNNTGQENCHVGPTSSPANVDFTIWNPTKDPQMIYLELRQLRDSLNQGKEILWESRIIHPDPQLLKPGEKRKATVVIDPAKADVGRGTTVNYSLTGYANGKIIGGANFSIKKK